jgi:aryl-alcohol dehydrogenase-like predicted oxidoreductase
MNAMERKLATDIGTTGYANRFPKLKANFRPILGVQASTIGIGTYLGEPDDDTDRAYEAALKVALLSGINLVDTAVNYRFQRSERCIGRVLGELFRSGGLRREEVIIATKGGYITFDGALPSNPRQWFDEAFVKTGIIDPEDLVDGSHCLTPRWLDSMLEMSLRNLGVNAVDIYYLHNPEAQLDAVGRDEFLNRIRRAFELLEARVSEGKIGAYGVATWNGFRVAPGHRTYLSLKELIGVAIEVGGQKHHFRVIQLPYNLAMPEALAALNQPVADGEGSPLDAARALGVAVCASAPLLQGRLCQGLPPIVGEALAGLSTDTQRAIQFVRSTPGVNVALVGMKSVAHVRETLAVAESPIASFVSLMKLFKRPAKD